MKKEQQQELKNGFTQLMKMTLTQLSLAILLTTFVFGGNPKAQDILNKPVSIRLENAELRDALMQLERTAEVQFVYSSKAIQANRKVSIAANNKKLSDVLDATLKPLKIGYRVIGGQIMLNADTRMSETAPLPKESGSAISNLIKNEELKIKNGAEIIDENPFNLTYYRLKINDLNGSSFFSKIISVKRSDTEGGKIKVYPNPVNDVLTIENAEGNDIEIINTLGQTVFSEKNVQHTSFNIHHLKTGVYYIKTANELARFVKNL
jgi:hypothetical protein